MRFESEWLFNFGAHNALEIFLSNLIFESFQAEPANAILNLFRESQASIWIILPDWIWNRTN